MIGITAGWTGGTYAPIDVTDIVNLVNSTYTYGTTDTGKVNIFLRNTGSNYRVVKTYEDTPSHPAYLIIEGTKNE